MAEGGKKAEEDGDVVVEILGLGLHRIQGPGLVHLQVEALPNHQGPRTNEIGNASVGKNFDGIHQHGSNSINFNFRFFP